MATVSKENMRKHRENIVKTWNANNSKKINAENLTTAYSKKKQEEERKRKEEEEKRKKEQEEARKKAERERRRKELQAKNRLKQKQTQSNRSKEHKSKSNMNEKTEKIFYDEWNKNKTSRAILGALEGAVKATTGSGIKDDKNRVTEETKKSGAYKAGEVGGQLGAYALGYGAVGGATAKVAGKAVGTQTAKKLTSKLAKNKIVKEAAKKTLKKQGQNATEKAVEHMARKTAKKIAEGMVKGAVADATVGTVLDSNIARSKGYEVGSDEWNKEMLINAGLNLGVGGAVEVAPTVLRALSKSKVAKNVPEAVVKASDNVELPKAKVDEVKAVDVPEVKAKAELPVKNEPVVKATDEAVSVVKNEVPQKTPRQQAYDDAVKLRDELMTKEIASNTEAVKNYEKQGVNVDFTPDRNRLDAGWEASDGFGYTTRSSANEQWYQDFWKKNGRQPNKSEAEAIVREHLENDLAFARNNPNSVGDMELGASSQLREADQKIALMEWEDEALNTYKVEPPETDWTPESGKLMSDKDFMDAIEKQYKTVENMESTAVESGLSKNDWLRMKYDEFYTFGKVDALDLPKETIGGFEVEGSSDLDLGIISKDFKAMEETFDRARTGWERFRKQFVTGQQELERMEKVGGIESTKGRTQALRNAQGTMAYIFNEKLVDSAGKVLDDRSYKQLIHQIPEKDLPDYNTYAQHLHNIYRIRENPDKAVFLQTSAEESKKIVLDLLKDHPEFKDYSREITNWWNKFTKAWLLDTGRMTQQAYDAMLKKYPRYIPTYRVDKGGGFVGLKNPLSAGKAVGSAVGGTSEVKALENGFLEEMQRIVRTTRRNDLYATVIEELRKNPDQLKQFGVAVDDAPTVLADDMTDFLDQIDKEGLKQVKNNVAKVTAYVDGKPVSAYINKELFDALELIENVADSRRYGILFNVGRAITNPLKAGITGLNPVFALANGLRDLPTLYIQSQNGVIKTTSNIGKAIKEIATKGEKYELYKALGGKHAGYFAQGKGFIDIKEFTSSPVRKTWRAVEGALSALGETTETIPRLAEFIGSLEKNGVDKDGALKALFDAGEVTVNFSRTAPATKMLDAWTLYLNAAVQGLDKFGRTMKAHPLQTSARSATLISLPYLALLAANYDNPHYHDLNERTKQNYFCIPNIFGERDSSDNAMTFIKIPVNREYGALFGSALDIVAGMLNGEENVMEGLDETFKTNFLPPSPFKDNVLAPIINDLPNNKDFAGRSIVPTSMLNASPIHQYDGSTSGAAKGIATVANNLSENVPVVGKYVPETLKSPKKVDFLMDSYGGFFGTVAQSLTSNKKGNPVSDRFSADPRFSSGVLEDFYNDMAEVETGKIDEGLEDTKGENYVKYKVYTEISEQLTELSKMEKEILSNDNLSKDQKQKQIKELREEKNKLARSAKTEAERAEAEYKQYPEFAVLDKKTKEKWQGSGVSKKEFAKAYNARETKDGAKKSVASAMEMQKAGVSYKAASAVDSSVSENVWSAAQNLTKSGVTPAQVQEIAKQIDRNNNGSYTKDEITGYLNGSRYSQAQKRALFDAFATWRNAQNPY